MLNVVAALATATIGMLATLGGVLADVSGSEVGPWAQVGGTATAVAALAYVAKLLADGKLVAQPIAEMKAADTKREETLRTLVEDAHGREDALRLLLMGKATGR